MLIEARQCSRAAAKKPDKDAEIFARAIANDIDVRLKLARTDTDIAKDAGRALELRSTIPDTVQAGSVGTWLQRESAERAAANAPGITQVDNRILVEPPRRLAADRPDEIC